jgi:nucleoid DNA-binding protein
MNRSSLVNKIINKYTDLDAKMVKNIVDGIFSFLTESLANNERVEIRKLGAFSIRERKDIETKLDFRKVVYFRHSKILK